MSFLNRLFGFNPIRQAEKIEAICAQAQLPCENIRVVATLIRKGVLSHPRAITEAMQEAMKRDYMQSKKEI